MQAALTWFFGSISTILTGLNYPIVIGNYSFGVLEFLLATFLIGVLVRNFVHTAR